MLRGESVDAVPFTVYENKVSHGSDERTLRNDGMCIVMRAPAAYATETPQCEILETRRPVTSTQDRISGSAARVETHIETPDGTLVSSQLDRGPFHNAWQEEYPFKDVRDYAALAAYCEDQTYVENFEAVNRSIERDGGDSFFRGSLGYSPLHHIIYRFMGIERFAYEWTDNRKEVLRLYEILVAKRLELARLAAASPNLAYNIGGNVSANVVSPEMYETYYLPIYNRTADILHGAGKLCGIHFDGITLPYSDLIARTDLDYVEALTPPPTCDVSVATAHELWPDKAIWANFPSSVHVEPEQRIRSVIRQMLSECRPNRRFLLGITEDVPPDRWPLSFRIILDEINAFDIRASS